MATQYKAPVEDYVFLLHDALGEETAAMSGRLDRDDTQQILEQSARFFEERWAPLDAAGDAQGCRFSQGEVTTPEGYKAAYDAMRQGGWNSVSAPAEYGGGGLPGLLGQAVREFAASSCGALSLYSDLTAAAHDTIIRAGEDWMRRWIVPRMVAGDWTGTMCLTEPHCGTDLRLMKSRAIPQQDGSWRVTGTKIFITGGDHDLAQNIIHLVLAKVPDENGRVSDDLSSVSLFLVSRRVLDPQSGVTGLLNGVTAAGIEHKMGLKGSATCTMVFEDSVAYRLGESRNLTGGQRKSSAGMSGMLDMMNFARLGTGLQALSTANRAYGHAANYARERLAGRAAKKQDRTGGASDPIIVHPDVRRLLLRQASFLEGGRALGLYVRMLLDDQETVSGIPRSWVGNLLTPVVKAFFSDRAFEGANDAMQVMGGHGYIRENGVEQLVRDCRIFQLYEGANGVQALDLAMRKLQGEQGSALTALLELVQAETERASSFETLRAHAQNIRHAWLQVEAAAAWLRKPERDPYDIGGASYDFLTMVGVLSVAFMWIRQSRVALEHLRDRGDRPLLQRKLVLANYWMNHELSVVQMLSRRIESGSTYLMELPSAQF